MHPVERHMMAFDGIFGGLSAQQTIAIASLLALFTASAAVAWCLTRRAAACRPHTVEHRAWTYCPKCGWPRPEAGDPTRAPDSPLPSDLLLQGWTRSPALDRDGRVVLPSDERAVIVAWSLWGAGSAALQAGSPRWSAWTRSMTDILAERHGGMSIQAFNHHPSRTAGEIVAVAQEAEMRAGLRSALDAAPV